MTSTPHVNAPTPNSPPNAFAVGKNSPFRRAVSGHQHHPAAFDNMSALDLSHSGDTLEFRIDHSLKQHVTPFLERLCADNVELRASIQDLKNKNKLFQSNIAHLTTKNNILHEKVKIIKKGQKQPVDEYTAPWLKTWIGEYYTWIVEKVVQAAFTALLSLGAGGVVYGLGRATFVWIKNRSLEAVMNDVSINYFVMGGVAFTISQMVLKGKHMTSDPLSIMAWGIAEFIYLRGRQLTGG